MDSVLTVTELPQEEEGKEEEVEEAEEEEEEGAAAEEHMEALGAAMGAGLPELQQLRWRVDVVLATSACARVLKPSILLELQLSDGTTRCVELSVKAFHELRYKVRNSTQATPEEELYVVAAACTPATLPQPLQPLTEGQQMMYSAPMTWCRCCTLTKVC